MSDDAKKQKEPDISSFLKDALAALGESGVVKDPDLFKPPPPREDCPVCMLVLPINPRSKAYMACCGKWICGACLDENTRVIEQTNAKRSADPDRELPLVEECCPFCRSPRPEEEEFMEQFRKRMKLNDANAIYNMACFHSHGMHGIQRNVRKGVKLNRHAADLGSIDACLTLAEMYEEGNVVGRDETEQRHYLELAAKGGHTTARNSLGALEYANRNRSLAIKHW
jgi:TPR repeat protein